jgi:predicted nucleotidyltransferase
MVASGHALTYTFLVMGKVFRSEQIRHGKYPESGDQITIAHHFMEQVSTLPDLHAAIVFGSTAIGNLRRRSDIDVALAYANEDPCQVANFHMSLQEILKEMSPGLIEPHIISKRSLEEPDQAQKGDVLLTEHLRLMAAESTIPGIHPEAFVNMVDPLRELTIDEAAQLAEHVTEAYLIQKRRKFFNAVLLDELSHAKLQRAFEFPTAITRKLVRVQALRSKSKLTTLPAEFYDRDSLAEVSLKDFTPSGDWHTSASWLIERDKEYSQLLEATISGHVSLEEYDKWLLGISEPSYQHAIKLSIAGLAMTQT